MKKSISISILILVLLAPVFPRNAPAQGAAPGQVAVVLILDNSGSMQTNDPDNLRFTAARLFVALLDEGDAAGLIVFSTESRPLTDGLVVIGTADQKRDLVRQMSPAPATGYTDVKAAFEDARTMLSHPGISAPLNAGRAGRKTVVVFLTDGQPEIPHPYPAYEREALEAAQGLGVPVLSIALTSAAQTPFLSQVAAETGGTVLAAQDASDLLDAYLEIFSQVKDRAVIGRGATTAPGAAELDLDPALAPYVEKVNFIVSKPESAQAALLGPDGKQVRADAPGVVFAMTDDPRFVVITIAQPAGGAWRFRLTGSGAAQARAILRSRLRAVMAAPHGFHEAGQPMPIVAYLIEEQADGRVTRIIGEASLSALITRPDGRQDSLDRFYDDGTHGDARAGDGEYTRLYVNTDQAGMYTIALQGRKGVVPVERVGRVEVIAFPEIIVDSPLQPRYDIRAAQPVTLQIRLEGGALDAGELIARITAPTGAGSETPMQFDGKAYTAAFLPKEDGPHQVIFEPRGATYRGLPYSHTAQASFETRLIPSISIRGAHIAPKVEMLDALQGITLTVKASSTSRQAETLQARLEQLPDFTLAEAGPFTLSPAQTTTLTLRLAAQEGTRPGALSGQLVFAAREGVDLEGGKLPVHFELFQPTLTVSPTTINLGLPASCAGWSGGLAVNVESTSLKTETVSLKMTGLPRMSLNPITVQVAPGKQQLHLTVTPQGDIAPGDYRVNLLVEGRKGLELKPGLLPITFRIEPVYSRCRGLVIGSGVFLMLIFLAAVAVVRRRKEKQRPPTVTGSLRHWPVERPAAAQTKDLTELKQTEVSIGRGGECDIVIPDPSLAELHAILRAERYGEQVRIILKPIGEVRIKLRVIRDETPLNHKDTFRMGQREFQYLSDTGE